MKAQPPEQLLLFPVRQSSRSRLLAVGLLVLLIATLLGSMVARVSAQAYGLGSPAPFGPYLNGNLPSTTPGVGGSPAAPATLSATGAFTNLGTLAPATGLIPYAVNSPLFTDYAKKLRWVGIPNDGTHDTPGEQVLFSEEGNWRFPVGTVFIKQFNVPDDENNPNSVRRVETRFLVHGSDGVYYAMTYRWRPDGSDADLLSTALEETIPITLAGGGTENRTWSYPGPTDCFACHNANSGRVLGPRTHQLNGLQLYPATGVTDNQIRTWNHLGIFSNPVAEADISGFLKSTKITDTSASLETRVRSYLSSNCSHCHQAGGDTGAYFDARFEVPLAQQNLINGPLLYDNGVIGANVITPKSVAQSIMHLRMSILGAEQMPPIGRNLVHDEAQATVVEWIEQLPIDGGGGGTGNVSPVALDDNAVGAHNSSIVINVLANDSDINGDSLSINSNTQPLHGTCVDNGNGSITYTPENGFSGFDMFTYTASDPSNAVSNSAMVILSVAAASTSQSATFSDQTNLLSDTSFKSGVAMVVADFNGDRKDDIARLEGAQRLRIEFQNTGSPFSFFRSSSIPSTKQWGMCAADVDENGINDVLTGGYYNDLKLYSGTDDASDWIKTKLPGPDIFLQAVGFADINNDGDVDLFACHDDGENRKYRNLGDGTFADDPSLLDTTTTPSSDNSGNYGIVWTDYDNDGDIDLYISKCRGGVSNPADPRRINKLMQNDGNNNYSEVGPAAGLAFGEQSWAADFADVDNDGDLDCFVGNHYAQSKLMLNNGSGIFSDATATSGIDLNWLVIQCVFRDFNNDGWVDLLVVGANHELYLNDGDGTFTLQANPFTGDDIESCAVGDLNHDGFVDVFAGYANLYNTPSAKVDKLFMNNTNPNNWFAVQLEGVQSNRNGIGARVEIHGPWGVQIREVRAGEGYGIQHSMTAHFGLGSYPGIDQLVVRWPSGTIETIFNPIPNQYFFLREGSAQPPVVNHPGDQNNTVGDSVSLTIAASDPTGDDLDFEANNLPPGLVMHPSTGAISGALGSAAVGSYSVNIQVSDGYSSASTNFVWTVSTNLSDWQQWVLSTPGAGGTPSSNLDGDYLDDLQEFALGSNPASGNIRWTGLRIEESGEGVTVSYTRPLGLEGVNYVLEGGNNLAGWTDFSEGTATNNGDGTETVRHTMLENEPGVSRDRGFVRLRIELPEENATSRTLPCGWYETDFNAGYSTYGISLHKKDLYSGVISSVAGSTITSSSDGLAEALGGMDPGYIEITSGAQRGHRYAVDRSGIGEDFVRVNFNSPSSTKESLPGNVTGSSFVVREHLTIGEVLDKNAWHGSTNIGAADQIQVYTNEGGGQENFTTYFLLDARPGNPAHYWRLTSGASADQGGQALLPGQGFFIKRSVGTVISPLLVGHVRANAFIQQLAEGFNLVSEPYPLDHTPVQRGALPPANDFNPSTNVGLADQVQTFASGSFTTRFLLDHPNDGPVWRMASGSSASQNEVPFFLHDRASFIRKSAADFGYQINPTWTP